MYGPYQLSYSEAAARAEEIPDTSYLVFLGITDKVVITPPKVALPQQTALAIVRDIDGALRLADPSAIKPPAVEITESPPPPEQTALAVVRGKDGMLRLANPSVISYEDMGDESCFNLLDPQHPEYLLLRAIVEWGMGPSRPYVEEILIEGRKLTVSFLHTSAEEAKAVMMMLFPGVGMTPYYKWR